MATQYFLPRPCHLDDLGEIVRLGRVQFFEAGTALAKDVFSDPALTITAGPSIELDSAGRFPDNIPQIWFGYGVYKIILQSFATGVWVDIWEAPYVPGSSDPGAGSTTSDVMVNTINDLKQIDTDAFTRAYVVGAASVTGGGGGHFRWSALDSTNDDGGWYIQRASGGIGRWIRILESGIKYLDIRMWQAQSNIGPIDSAYNSAYAIAATKNIPVYFGNGMWKWQDSTVVFGSVYIDEGARFSTVTVGTFSLTFAGKVEINSKSSLTTFDTLKVSFSGSSLEYYDIRWGVNYFEACASAVLSNLPLLVESPIILPYEIGTAETRIIIGPRGSIDCSTFVLNCQSLQVEGNRRRVIATDGPIPNIYGVENVYAWWFGYGVDSVETDHTDYLILADACAIGYGANLVLNRPVVGGIERPVSLLSSLIIEGPINLNTSVSSVTISSFNRLPSSRIFTFGHVDAVGVVNSYVANPLWWGMHPQASEAANLAGWNQMLKSTNVNQCWIDGNNTTFNMSTYNTVNAIHRMRNMNLNITTDDVALFKTSGVVVFEMVNCMFSSPTSTVAPVYIGNTIGQDGSRINIERCTINGGLHISCASTDSGSYSFVNVKDNYIFGGVLSVKLSSISRATIESNHLNFCKTEIYPYAITLSGVSVHGNHITGSTIGDCDIQFIAESASSVMKSILVTDNRFSWIGTNAEQVLINPIESGSGTWIDYQDIHVADNVIISSHAVAGAYPDLGLVQGPYVSSTDGSDVILFNQIDVNDSGASDYIETLNTRIGPLFIPYSFNSISAISGTVHCEQVEDLEGDGITFNSVIFSFLKSAFNDTRFINGRAIARISQAYRTGANSFYMRPEAIIKWGLRGDIGRNSKNAV